MNSRDDKIRIQLHRAAEGRLSLIIEYATRHHGHAESIKSYGVSWLQLGRPFRKEFGVSETLGIDGAGARLHQRKAQRHQRLGAVRRKLNRLAISVFGIVPTLLIDEHISQPVKSARVSRLQFERGPIRAFGSRELAGIAGIVAICDRVFELLFYLRRISSWRSGSSPWRGRASLGLRIFRPEDSRTAAQLAPRLLCLRHARANEN